MSKETSARVQSFEHSDFLRHSSFELSPRISHTKCGHQVYVYAASSFPSHRPVFHQFVMSSEVETSLISNSLQHRLRDSSLRSE